MRHGLRATGNVLRVIVASIYGTGFLVVSGILAVWSLWWIIKAAKTNPDERQAEVDARARVAAGGSWTEGEAPPRALTDAEIAALSESQMADDPAASGVDVKPRERPARRRGRSS